MKNFIARIFSKRVSMLESVVKFQNEQLRAHERKITQLSSTNRGLHKEIEGYYKLTNKLTSQVIEHQKNVASGKYENKKANKVITRKFTSWMKNHYGISLKDGNLFWESKNGYKFELIKTKNQ